MKEIKTTIYECEFCRRYYKRKHFAIAHEPKCRKNPDNYKICHGCDYLEMKEVSINFQDHNGHDDFQDKKLLYCGKKNIFVYPLSIENSYRGGYLQEDIEGEIPNEAMPSECDLYEPEQYF